VECGGFLNCCGLCGIGRSTGLYISEFDRVCSWEERDSLEAVDLGEVGLEGELAKGLDILVVLS